MKKILLILILLSFCEETVSAKDENRIILDEDFSWVSPRKADELIDRIKKAGFNILVPCVWHGRGVSWKSNIAPREPRWERERLPISYDPLHYLVQSAKRAGIEVHPWFTFSLRQRDFLDDFYDRTNTPLNGFDVHRAEFRTFMIRLIAEVVSRYDVQGINLDYVRTRGTCTCARCILQYRSTTGRDLLEDVQTYKLSPSAKESLIKWNSTPVSLFLSDLRRTMGMLKKDIIISCDSHPGRKELFIEGADSIQWIKKDLCDFVLSMDYGPTLNKEEFIFAKSKVRDNSRIVIIVGNYENNKTDGGAAISRYASLTTDLVSKSKNLHPDNIATGVYCYKFLNDCQVNELGSTVYSVPATAKWKRLER